jgi:hypothetical protein
MKTLRILSIALLGLSVMLTSCSKDDKVNAPDSLTGTSWFYEGEDQVVNGVTVAVGLELEFETATSGNLAVIVGGKATDGTVVVAGMPAGDFTYSYAKPTVTITIDGEKETATIDGDKLTIVSDGEKIVFVKE